MVDIMKFNKTKLNELSKNIMECNGDYKLYCIDVDDVVFRIAPLMQKIFERIDKRSTNRYRERIVKETPQDSQAGFKMSYAILNAILEETKCVIEKDNGQTEELDFSMPLIDYEALYSDENLYPLAVEYINTMIKNKEPNEFFIFVSHRNPEREGVIKTRRLYELFPEIDGVITLPFHEKVGSSKVNDKGLWVRQNLLLENLEKAILIDNSKSNCKTWNNKPEDENIKNYNNGTYIRFLENGFDEDCTLSDHMSKLTDLDPHMIQFSLSFIEYVRKHPEYAEEVDNREKVKKL